MKRRTLLAGLGLAGAGGLAMPAIRPASAATLVGVTATEIKIGHIVPYSGNASSYGVGGRSHTAFFKRVNDMGGVAGRKINFISLDDGYNPAKTVEQARRLVEQATEVIRRYRPDIVMTVDPGSDYVRWHKTDHRMAAMNTLDDCAAQLRAVSTFFDELAVAHPLLPAANEPLLAQRA